MGKNKRRHPTPLEPKMPMQEHNDITKTIEADKASAEVQAAAEAQTANREAAALEERLAAERVAQARMSGVNTEYAMTGKQPEEEESLGALASKGRDALLARLRQREAEKTVPSYVPPPLTDRQRTKLEEEMEAGRRSVARHAEQAAYRPPQKADPVKEGFTTPVHRNGLAVPDPKSLDVRPGEQTNNKGIYSPTV